MKNNELKLLVLDELASESDINIADLGIVVEEGIVTLYGSQPNLVALNSVEEAVKRVGGVKAIAVKVSIAPNPESPTDKALAMTIVRLLELNPTIPIKQIQIIVESGVVTLSGVVERQHQRLLVKSYVESLKGVVEVIDKIGIAAKVTDGSIKTMLVNAMFRRACIDQNTIDVDVVRGVVYLSGTVRNLLEKESVEQTTWSVPGVKFIVDHLEVDLKNKELSDA